MIVVIVEGDRTIDDLAAYCRRATAYAQHVLEHRQRSLGLTIRPAEGDELPGMHARDGEPDHSEVAALLEAAYAWAWETQHDPERPLPDLTPLGEATERQIIDELRRRDERPYVELHLMLYERARGRP